MFVVRKRVFIVLYLEVATVSLVLVSHVGVVNRIIAISMGRHATAMFVTVVYWFRLDGKYFQRKRIQNLVTK